MPYKDRIQQMAYQREWVAQRRKDWFDKNGPCEECGSNVDLQLDHRDPSQKVTHRIWTWSKARREEELAKCRPLCKSCHNKKTITEQPPQHGEHNPRARLTASQVEEIRNSRDTNTSLASQYGVSAGHIRRIRSGARWAA